MTNTAAIPAVMTRTQHYMARVAAHLPALAGNAARAAFIASELAKWEDRYSAFIAQVDAGQDSGAATAWDYTQTILALQAEQARYPQEAA